MPPPDGRCDGHAASVLVVEHSPALRERLVTFVRELPAAWEVDECTPRDALDRLLSRPFEAVLVDVDCIEAAALIRVLQRLEGLPYLVALTGDGTPEAQMRWRGAGVDHVVLKWEGVDALGAVLLALHRGLHVH
jgi:CheY-like chemotaxis protein